MVGIMKDVVYLTFENIYVIVSMVVILVIVTNILIMRFILKRKYYRGIYECIDYFIRNCHDTAFYNPQNHATFTEYEALFVKCKKHRKSWFLGTGGKIYMEKYLYWFDEIQTFMERMSSFMSDDHYFAHSEFLKCMEELNIEENTEFFLNNQFLKYVNNVIPESYLDLEKYKRALSIGFSDIPQKHNEKFVQEELANNKEYFDTVLKYPLDKQQRASIVKLEDNCLVISSAGSGKTSTSVAKIKYLVDKRHIAPARILPLTYTAKAAKELTDRLALSAEGLRCYTFHSLAFHILAEATQEKPDVCDTNTMLKCFYYLVDHNADFKKAINKFLTDKKSLTKNEHEYVKAEDYYADRALYGIQAPFLDMDGRIIFTRSEEEKKICTFLSMNGISFRYEQPYFKNTATEFKRQYRPDFTIYFQQNGRLVFVVLEHFGIDAYGNVPVWFGENKKGGFYEANDIYKEGIKWKRAINRKYNTILLETTSAMFHDGTIYERLTQQLKQYGIPMRELTEDEKFEKLVKRNKRMEDSILQLVTTFITLMKSNRHNPESVLNLIKKENNNPLFIERSEFMIHEIFQPIFDEYEKMLHENNQIDYTDLILKATDVCNSGLYKKEYDMILVDEFQDISVDRFELLQSLRNKKNLTKLYCVGDDWQSIFRFSGSDLSLFNGFEEHFGFSEKCAIETTYRFGNPTIDISSQFIMENSAQVPKEIKPVNESVRTEIKTVAYYTDDAGDSKYEVLEKIVSKIPSEQSIMLIGRYHSDAEFIPNELVMRNEKGNIVSVHISNRDIPYNTIHSAKGLEADNVIVVSCSQDGNGFPSRVSDDPILGYVLSAPETFPYAEERRLFYVAITRARKQTYVMYNEKSPSCFITELAKKQGMFECPWCHNGNLKVVKEGENGIKHWRLYGCTNYTAGCQYTLFLDYCDEKEIQTKINSIINRSILPRSPIIPPLPSPFPYMSQQNKVVEDENNDELPF